MTTTTTTYERRQFPRPRCPAWCIGEHKAALEAGNTLEMASVHLSSDHGDRLYSLHNPRTGAVVRPGAGGWSVSLSQPGTIGWEALTLVRLEVDDDDYRGHRQVVTLDMAAAEALVLARALTALAESEMQA